MGLFLEKSRLFNCKNVIDNCGKDYSEYIDIAKYSSKNPNAQDKNPFSKKEIAKLWSMKDDCWYQIPLMLIYSEVLISE